MSVAVTLEQCSHHVPGGTAVAALDSRAGDAATPRSSSSASQRDIARRRSSEWRPPVAVLARSRCRGSPSRESGTTAASRSRSALRGPVDVDPRDAGSRCRPRRARSSSRCTTSRPRLPQMFDARGAQVLRARVRARARETRRMVAVLVARRRSTALPGGGLRRRAPAARPARRPRSRRVPEAAVLTTLARFGLRRGYVLWTAHRRAHGRT